MCNVRTQYDQTALYSACAITINKKCPKFKEITSVLLLTTIPAMPDLDDLNSSSDFLSVIKKILAILAHNQIVISVQTLKRICRRLGQCSVNNRQMSSYC